MVLTAPEDVAGLPLSLLKLTAEAAAAAESIGTSKEESRFYILIILYCIVLINISIRIKQVNFWEHNDWAFHQDKWNCLSYVGIYNKQVSIEQGFTVQHFPFKVYPLNNWRRNRPQSKKNNNTISLLCYKTELVL